MLVLEQLLDHVERLPLRRRKEVAADVALGQQRLALGLRQRIGEPLGQEDLRGDLLGFAVPVAEGLRVLLGEARDVGQRLLEVAAENESRAVEMRLAELVARRDVFDAVAEVEVLEPRRLADVEVIDGVQVVLEARRGDLFRHQRATVLQAAVDQQDVEPAFGEIAAEHQAVVACADDDTVVGSIECCGHDLHLSPSPCGARPTGHASKAPAPGVATPALTSLRGAH